MGYFDSEKNVQEYIAMAEGYDGSELIEELKKYVAPGSRVLELGMGPGKDLDILQKYYKVTGSDNSQVFIDLYNKQNKDADVMLLDAVTMDTDRKFDCIYSNKVLHHLTRHDLKKSIINQCKVLKDKGILFHSLWYGDKEEFHHDLRFIYYNEDSLKKLLVDSVEIIENKTYTEIDNDDSFYIILQKAENLQ